MGVHGCSKSFDYKRNKIYQKYIDNNNTFNYEVNSLIVYSNEEIINLIDEDKLYIRIYNFHTAYLLNKIPVRDSLDKRGLDENLINCLSLWKNNNYLLVGYGNTIRIIDLNEKKIILKLLGHNRIMTIKAFIHPKVRECFISQGIYEDSIKLWLKN